MNPSMHRVVLDVRVVLRCASCGDTFDDDLERAKQHALTIGPKPLLDQDGTKYPCPKCDKVFTTEGWLTRHLNKEHGVD